MIRSEKGFTAGSRKDAILAKYGVEPSREREIPAGEPVEDIITGPARVQMYLKAIQRQSALEKEAERKEEKEPPIEETPLYKAIVRVRSGKSPVPTPEEVDADAAGLPTYRKDTYTPAPSYGAWAQEVKLPETESGYKRGGLASLPGREKETDPVERDRKEAEALGARLRLGEADDREFEEYLERMERTYGYIPPIGSKAETLEELQSYLRGWQPKAETFAQQRAEGRDPLSRIGNMAAGAAKQYAGSLVQAGKTLLFPGYEGMEERINAVSGDEGEREKLLGIGRSAREKTNEISRGMQAFADGLSQSGGENIAKAQEGLNPAGRLLVKTGVGAAQMAGDAVLAAATGGSAMVPMLARSFGGGVQEARAKGYGEGQQVLLGLSGVATEYFSERLFGGNPVYDSEVGLVNRLVGKIVKNPTVMEVLSSAPVDLLTEGLEEVVSDLLAPVAEWAITGNKPEYELDQIIEDGVVGVLTALIAKGGTRVLKSVLGKRKGTMETEGLQAEKTAPGEGTESIRVGKATVLKIPYFGETPVQEIKERKSTPYVSDELVNRAHIMIENAVSGAQMGHGAFKNLLTRAYEAIFKPSKQVEVEGLTFQGEAYYVDINKGVPAKVISDVNHSAEKLALLEILPEIVKNGEYVGSTIGKKTAIRYDHFETSVIIHKKPYLVLFETEVYPGTNNYKTHRLINMELAPQTDGVTGTPPAPSAEKPTPYN